VIKSFLKVAYRTQWRAEGGANMATAPGIESKVASKEWKCKN